jgi:hypothetical protein
MLRRTAVAGVADENLAAPDCHGATIGKWREFASDDLFEFVGDRDPASGFDGGDRLVAAVDLPGLVVDRYGHERTRFFLFRFLRLFFECLHWLLGVGTLTSSNLGDVPV